MDNFDPLQQGPEVLSQNEVENLLAQVMEQEAQAAPQKQDGAGAAAPKEGVQPCDFRMPSFLSAPELRRIRLEHEEFISKLASTLSLYLRLEFGLQMSRLETIPYIKFTEGIVNPSHLTLFKVEPLRGVCILEVNPRMGLTIVDRLMGGAGHSVSLDRDLSEIELALLGRAAGIMIAEWCNHWIKYLEIRPVTLGQENNGQFLQTSLPDAMMLVVTMEARLADCLEPIQLAFPYSTIEPLLKLLGQKVAQEAKLSNETLKVPLKWNPQLDTVEIPVGARWPSINLTARGLSQLKVGDILDLDPEVTGQVQVRLGDIPKFVGRLGTRGQKWAVEITKQIKP